MNAGSAQKTPRTSWGGGGGKSLGGGGNSLGGGDNLRWLQVAIFGISCIQLAGEGDWTLIDSVYFAIITSTSVRRCRAP